MKTKSYSSCINLIHINKIASQALDLLKTYQLVLELWFCHNSMIFPPAFSLVYCLLEPGHIQHILSLSTPNNLRETLKSPRPPCAVNIAPYACNTIVLHLLCVILCGQRKHWDNTWHHLSCCPIELSPLYYCNDPWVSLSRINTSCLCECSNSFQICDMMPCMCRYLNAFVSPLNSPHPFNHFQFLFAFTIQLHLRHEWIGPIDC